MNDDTKQTIILDFDGVIHSYESGWKGAENIPDPPVLQAAEALVGYVDHFTVAIFSSRTGQSGGVYAMKSYIVNQVLQPYFLGLACERTGDADRFDHKHAHQQAVKIVDQIDFPVQKPPAIVSIDDRAICFDGIFPSPEEIQEFKPWNR